MIHSGFLPNFHTECGLDRIPQRLHRGIPRRRALKAGPDHTRVHFPSLLKTREMINYELIQLVRLARHIYYSGPIDYPYESIF